MTDRSLQELLLSIVVGGRIEARLHESTEFKCEVCGDRPSREHAEQCGVIGRWSRVSTWIYQRPGEHPGLWEELQTTIARLSKTSSSAGTGAHSAETPVPYHKRASDVAAQLGNAVVTWARLVAEENPELVLTARTVPDAARWIVRWLGVFPSLLGEHLDEMHADIARWVRKAERVIDHGPDRIFAGRCETPLTDEGRAAVRKDPSADVPRCTADIYARKDKCLKHEQPAADCQRCKAKGFVSCRECGAVHDVAYRKDWLSTHLAGSLVTAAEAAPYLSWLTGKDIKVDTVHKWRRHRAGCEADEDDDNNAMCSCTGRIVVRGRRDGRPLYRFGDLRIRADELKTRASKPRGKEGSAA